MIISNAMVCTAMDHGDKEGEQDQEVNAWRERGEGQEKAAEQGKQQVEKSW